MGVFAITGSLAAGRRKLDIFGVVVLGTVTAIGGGTLRDLILGAPTVFWVANTTYLWVAVGGSLLTARYSDTYGPLGPGRTITLDAVDFSFVPGQRFDRAQLKITARTSKGGRHEIELPAAAAGALEG